LDGHGFGSFRCNEIGDAGAVALAKALESNSTVTTVEYVACVEWLLWSALWDFRLEETAL
jgi:hypothetical protein